MGSDTEVVRGEADRWSLAGDRQLLAILKTMHEKVVTRATHVDTKVQEMMSGIRCAGVALENVNNRLASLSSNQFIESRVYDDDSEVKMEPGTQNEQPKSQKCESSPSEGVLVLHRFYEELEILPDSSDTDDDEEHPSNVVLRAKDLYADRPLPAIIGSATWKSKWHAGLLEEDSDSDSSVCKRDSNVDQYSSSDDGEELQESLPINREHHESFTSEDILVSDEDSTRVAGAGRDSKVGQTGDHYATQPQGPGAEKTDVAQSQSDFAAELARRLGGHVSQAECTATVAPPTVDVRSGHAARHMFSDQLSRHRVPGNLFSDEPPPLDAVSDDDMFDTQRPAHRHHDAIFDDDDNYNDDDNDIFDDFADIKVAEPSRKPKEIDPPVSTVKKPVGGKSLFGSQKGAESIGAAIRKRRESSSDDEAQHPQDNTVQKLLGDVRTNVDDEKPDIFDDLFAKSEQENKKLELKDDIFDDIDDIFSTEIVTKAAIKEVTITKNIFDDHDELFADIDVNFDFKSQKPSRGNQKVVDAIAKDAPSTSKYSPKVANSEDFQNIFGDDDDNNDGLFSNTAKTEISKDKFKAKSLFDGSDEELFKEVKDYTNNSSNVTNNVMEPQRKIQQEFEKQSNIMDNNTSVNKTEEKPNLFEDNKSDDLFVDHKSDQNNELKQEIVDSDANRRENVEEKVNTEPTSSVTMSNEDHHIEKEYINDVSKSEPNNLKYDYQRNEPITRDELNISSQHSTQEDLLSNKEYIDEKLGSRLHKTNLSRKQNDFSDAEKNIDELFRNSVKNDNASSSVTNDFHDIFNDHAPAVEKTNDIKKSSNINALFEDDDDIDENISSTNDFHDVFNDQPPAFEKSKDIKKSKNINALFDDDSDDESLFFKKNDTLEEKPEVFVAKNDSDRIFGLFNDEPPAVVSDDDDIFGNKHVIEKKSGEGTSKFATKKEQPDVPPISVPVKVENIDHVPKENVAANTEKTIQKPDGKDVFIETDARKSVGKIKSNININVNTLLPGASPKKIVRSPEPENKDNERIDRSNETSELDGGVFNKPLEASPKIKEYPGLLVKSASFDGNTESPVLCNKFSKDRAKIQVRRRPSTRKARREAIKRSDTDTDLAKVSDDTDSPVQSNISTLGRVYTDIQKKQGDKQSVKSDSDSDFSTTINDIKEPQSLPKCESDKDIPQSINKDVFQIESVGSPNTPDKPQLIIEDSDDEDIFKTFAHKSEPMVQKMEPMEIQKPKETSKVEQTPIIETRKVETPKQKSLFGDDSSDEELFGGSKHNKKSDSAKSSDTLLTKQPPVTQSKSLFGDDSDEDIFAARAKVTEHSQPTKREEKSVILPSSLPVTEDPLSMFDTSE